MRTEKVVYVDDLSLAAARRVAVADAGCRVLVLQPLDRFGKVLKYLLKCRKIAVVEAAFFAGHIRSQNGESVYITARRIANDFAETAVAEALGSTPRLKAMAAEVGHDKLVLHVARSMTYEIEAVVVKILVVAGLEVKPCVLRLPRPLTFDEKILKQIVPETDIDFYGRGLSPGLWKFLRLPEEVALGWAQACIRTASIVFGLRHAKVGPRAPSLVVLQNDTVREDQTYRSQFFWLRHDGTTFEHHVHILTGSGKTYSSDGLPKELSRDRVHFYGRWSYLFGGPEVLRHPAVEHFRQARRTALQAAWLTRDLRGRLVAVRSARLLRYSLNAAAFSIHHNARVFATAEVGGSECDSMCLAAERLPLTVITWQYSNIPFYLLAAVPMSGVHFTFASQFARVLTRAKSDTVDLRPNGYPYTYAIEQLRRRARIHRKALERVGAQFVVCYFNESVQGNRWGLVHPSDYLSDLELLAARVIDDPTFAVVLKPQFARHTVKTIATRNSLLESAIRTERFLELTSAGHRNDVLPAEAALVSDLAIGHKFGATAALEAAVAGVRTVLIDVQGCRTEWDTQYSRSEIIFPDLTEVLGRIDDVRANRRAASTFGAWEPVLDSFVLQDNSEGRTGILDRIETGLCAQVL